MHFGRPAALSSAFSRWLILIMGFHACEQVLKGLNLARNGEPALVIKTELLLHLLQQNLEDWKAEIARGDDEPPKFWSNINCKKPSGNINREFIMAVDSFLV
uniref:Uncharacterized protein n=1 Tax=Nelumbo nucifera TaxID=4432 RepID=A0A822ZX89_NELNU|nr:TPA_asm: hypothetical protein HUJ06_019057 [Nelumbo nucifera]